MRRYFMPLLAIAFLFPLFSITHLPASAQSGDKPGVADELKDPLARIARRLVAERNGIDLKDLKVINSTMFFSRLQGKAAHAFKLMKADGTLQGVILNDSGQELNEEHLIAAEREAHLAKYGRLEPALAEKLETASSDELIDVTLWIKDAKPLGGDDLPEDSNGSMTEEEIGAKVKQLVATRNARVNPHLVSFARKLEKHDPNVKLEERAPVIHARLTPGAIRKIATEAELDQVYLSSHLVPHMYEARRAMNAQVMESRGITGDGVIVAQVELGAKVNTNNPYLGSGVLNAGYDYICDYPDTHATALAGIITSDHSISRGIAPNVRLHSWAACNGEAWKVHNLTNWARDLGASVINLSWGRDDGATPTSWGEAKWYDYWVFANRRLIVASAGNDGTGTGNVSAPSGYNVFAVGTLDDRGTLYWGDDGVYPTSSWRNPVSWHNDRQKPEVIAPGTDINTTLPSSPWIGVPNGDRRGFTSYAAAATTGAAALLIQRWPPLSKAPEALKAIFMATARSMHGTLPLGEYDGAGSIWTDKADNVVGGGGTWGQLDDYYCDTAPDVWDVASMYFSADRKTRVAITWPTNPDVDIHWPNRPTADLDLQVLDPWGNLVASSSSWDNNTEMVDFFPYNTGYYRLRVVKYRCGDFAGDRNRTFSPRYLGFAWHQY
jgi:hypothetical protein